MLSCLYLLPSIPHPSCSLPLILSSSSSLDLLCSPLLLWPSSSPPPSSVSTLSLLLFLCAGASVVLLAGGGRADFPSGLGSGPGRTQLHVVCGWPRPLRLGPGGFAQSPVCHPTAGLEGRAAQVRTPPSGPAVPPVLPPWCCAACENQSDQNQADQSQADQSQSDQDLT